MVIEVATSVAVLKFHQNSFGGNFGNYGSRFGKNFSSNAGNNLGGYSGDVRNYQGNNQGNYRGNSSGNNFRGDNPAQGHTQQQDRNFRQEQNQIPNENRKNNAQSNKTHTVAHASVKLGFHQTISGIGIGPGNSQRLNILLDTGSPLCLLEENMAKLPGLKPIGRDPLEIQGIGNVLHAKVKYNKYLLKLKSIKGDQTVQIPVYGIEKVC